jgi:hypothetical protein
MEGRSKILREWWANLQSGTIERVSQFRVVAARNCAGDASLRRPNTVNGGYINVNNDAVRVLEP